jgi:hypothetical protein
MKFGQWLKKQKGRQDAVGDFARDYVAGGVNGSCCGRFQKYDTILVHIESEHHPCEGALKALKRAYAEYRLLTGNI